MTRSNLQQALYRARQAEAKREAAQLRTPLAPDHMGMMVEGLRVLRQSFAGSHYMRKEMAVHLEELARRFYAGDVAVVDEFLQLYRIGTEERQAAKRRKAQEGGAA